MFGLIKKHFVGLLTDSIYACNHIKCVSLSNEKCEIQLTLTNLHPNEYSQELHCCPFAVKLDKCVGSSLPCSSSKKLCVPNKTEYLNLSMLIMITGKNESKTLTKHISCECKCKFDGRKCNSNQKLNNDKCWCECKKHNICKKDYIWNPATCSCENGKYLANIADDSVITWNYRRGSLVIRRRNKNYSNKF